MVVPSDRLVHIAEPRLVVARDQQLELGRESEYVLAHEARGYAIATGQRLDPRVGSAWP